MRLRFTIRDLVWLTLVLAINMEDNNSNILTGIMENREASFRALLREECRARTHTNAAFQPDWAVCSKPTDNTSQHLPKGRL